MGFRQDPSPSLTRALICNTPTHHPSGCKSSHLSGAAQCRTSAAHHRTVRRADVRCVNVRAHAALADAIQGGTRRRKNVHDRFVPQPLEELNHDWSCRKEPHLSRGSIFGFNRLICSFLLSFYAYLAAAAGSLAMQAAYLGRLLGTERTISGCHAQHLQNRIDQHK